MAMLGMSGMSAIWLIWLTFPRIPLKKGGAGAHTHTHTHTHTQRSGLIKHDHYVLAAARMELAFVCIDQGRLTEAEELLHTTKLVCDISIGENVLVI